MARLPQDPARSARAAERDCGTCSLCCTLLRVDPIGKPAGRDCVHQRPEGGCGIYDSRPSICRGYQCLWLQGGLEDDERPDRTRGVVDLQTTGIGLRLDIREAEPGAFDKSPSLAAIAARYRTQMPVRITNASDMNDPDRPFRVLLGDGVEQHVSGDTIEIYRNGMLEETRRQGWAERLGRRIAIAWRRRGLRNERADFPDS